MQSLKTIWASTCFLHKHERLSLSLADRIKNGLSDSNLRCFIFISGYSAIKSKYAYVFLVFEVFFFPYSFSYNVFPISSLTACFIWPVFKHSLFHFLAYSITSCFSLKVQPAFSFSSKKLSSFFYRLANTSRPTLTNLEIDLFALHFLTFSPNAKVLSAEKAALFSFEPLVFT